MREIGSLTSVPIREVWPNEAADLTPWLAANPGLLSKALGMDLELKGQEVPVGPFSADTCFRSDDPNALVVVENMMLPTDHDHLGKVITYAAGLEAAHEDEGFAATCAVLLAEKFRPEHRTALQWLNMHTREAVAFFGIEIEAWSIGGSLPAPKLNVVVRPDDWAREVRAKTAEEGLSETQRLYRDFWSEFLPPLDDAHPGWLSDRATTRKGRNKSPWLVFRMGNGQRYAVAREKVGGQWGICVEFCVEGDDMERIYEGLIERRSTIEARLGEEIQCKESPKLCKLFVLNPGGIGIHDRERWPEVRAWAIKRLGELRDAIQPHLAELALAEDDG